MRKQEDAACPVVADYAFGLAGVVIARLRRQGLSKYWLRVKCVGGGGFFDYIRSARAFL